MTEFNFSETIEEAEKTYGVGGGNDQFKFKQGPNKIRVLACSTKPLASHYVAKGQSYTCIGEDKGCFFHGENALLDDKGMPKKPSIQYLIYLLDRTDNKVKFCYSPYSIIKAITNLQNTEDYTFKDIPMPYDLNVTYDENAGPAQKYVILPSPKFEPVSAEVLAELKTKKSLDEIREKIKEKGKVKIDPNFKSKEGVQPFPDDDIPVIEPDAEKVKEEDLPF